MEQNDTASVLILPDISAFWPAHHTPEWTTAGIDTVLSFSGNGHQVILAASMDNTVSELFSDDASYGYAWAHWLHEQAKQGVTTMFTGTQPVPYFSKPDRRVPASGRMIELLVVGRDSFDCCHTSVRQSMVWQDLLGKHLEVHGWRTDKLLMGNLKHHVTAPPDIDPQVVVLENIRGQLSPFKVVIPATY